MKIHSDVTKENQDIEGVLQMSNRAVKTRL